MDEPDTDTVPNWFESAILSKAATLESDVVSGYGMYMINNKVNNRRQLQSGEILPQHQGK